MTYPAKSFRLSFVWKPSPYVSSPSFEHGNADQPFSLPDAAPSSQAEKALIIDVDADSESDILVETWNERRDPPAKVAQSNIRSTFSVPSEDESDSDSRSNLEDDIVEVASQVAVKGGISHITTPNQENIQAPIGATKILAADYPKFDKILTPDHFSVLSTAIVQAHPETSTDGDKTKLPTTEDAEGDESDEVSVSEDDLPALASSIHESEEEEEYESAGHLDEPFAPSSSLEGVSKKRFDINDLLNERPNTMAPPMAEHSEVQDKAEKNTSAGGEPDSSTESALPKTRLPISPQSYEFEQATTCISDKPKAGWQGEPAMYTCKPLTASGASPCHPQFTSLAGKTLAELQAQQAVNQGAQRTAQQAACSAADQHQRTYREPHRIPFSGFAHDPIESRYLPSAAHRGFPAPCPGADAGPFAVTDRYISGQPWWRYGTHALRNSMPAPHYQTPLLTPVGFAPSQVYSQPTSHFGGLPAAAADASHSQVAVGTEEPVRPDISNLVHSYMPVPRSLKRNADEMAADDALYDDFAEDMPVTVGQSDKHFQDAQPRDAVIGTQGESVASQVEVPAPLETSDFSSAVENTPTEERPRKKAKTSATTPSRRPSALSMFASGLAVGVTAVLGFALMIPEDIRNQARMEY